MMNAWIFIVTLILILAVLFGRYRLRILLSRTGECSGVVVRLRSLANVVGLEWQSNGSDSSSRLFLFGRALRISGKNVEAPEPTGKIAEHRPSSPKKESRRLAVHHLHKVFRVGWKALVRIVRVFHLEQGAVNVRFGTGDPFTTGMLYGLAQILLILRRKRTQVKVVPDFINRKLEGEADLTFRFTMLRLVAVLIAVLVRAAVEFRKS
jgi:hypothetical protein